MPDTVVSSTAPTKDTPEVLLPSMVVNVNHVHAELVHVMLPGDDQVHSMQIGPGGHAKLPAGSVVLDTGNPHLVTREIKPKL